MRPGYPRVLLLLALSSLVLGATPVVKDQVKNYPSRVSSNSDSGPWTREIVDTAAGTDYLTDAEKQVIVEINMVRTDPGEYARRFLVPLRSYYRGTLLEYPGETPILTKEGVRALEECLKVLQVTRPLSPLSPKKGLALSARALVRDQGPTGATGHIGSDKSTPEKRMSRYGRWGSAAGEDIDYGSADPKRIVISLLVDDGVASRSHRKILLSGMFKFVGVAVGPHKVFRHMCVIDSAAFYQDESAAGRYPSYPVTGSRVR